MSTWLTMGAALAALTWYWSRNPTDATALGLTLFFGSAVVMVALSNRVQRRIRAITARLLCRFWFDRGQSRLRMVAPLERVRTLSELFDRLPGVTASAAGVEPVTLFALDEEGSQYLPVSSTLHTVPCYPVGADDPLARTLRKSRRVHYLEGRTDDLENAPIHAMNWQQVEECQAVCALPLRRDGTLVAFLLCGGSEDNSRLGLLNSGRLESLGQRYADLVGRCTGTDITIAGRLAASPVVAQRSVSA